MQFAVLPPLIIDALLRIVTGRGSARPGGRSPGALLGGTVRTGAWLGLLTAAQLFTGEELLAHTALTGLVLVVLLAAGRPRAALHRARGAVLGLATGAGVALVICGYALWVQFRGPLSEHGSPWPPDSFTSHPGALVTPPGTLLFHTPASAAAAGTPVPAAHARAPRPAGPGRLAGGLRQAAACPRRPRARRPRPQLARPRSDALAGGHGRAWLAHRRLVRRTRPDR